VFILKSQLDRSKNEKRGVFFGGWGSADWIELNVDGLAHGKPRHLVVGYP